MTSGFQALTEKEKETLRLLVDGHDAKSMARHLGLSVHTVNERLRDARRKMAVSSSREAARKLRAIEQRGPEYRGDRLSGDAFAVADRDESAAPVDASRMVRRIGWVFGGIVMSLSLALFALASWSGPMDAPAASQSAAQPAASPETVVVETARAWLTLVDREDWNGSWNATGQAFKALNTSDLWAEVSRSVRPPLGAVLSREAAGEEAVPAPPYGYRMVRFRTRFANKADAVETLSLVREGGAWRVVGYTID